MLVLVKLALTALIAGADPTYDTVFLQDGGTPRGAESGPGAVESLIPRLLFPSFFAGNLTLGWASAHGDASSATAMADLTKPQFYFGLEAGVRLVPALTLGTYLELGRASTGSAADHQCHADGFHCDATSVHVGGLLRYAFTPTSPSTAWVAVGSGYESTDVSDTSPDVDRTLVTYTGWEYLRLSAGWDFRGNGTLGFGFQVLLGVGRYNTLEDASGKVHLASAPLHGWLQVGTKFMYGP